MANGGFLTRIGLAIVVFGLFSSFGVYLMVDIGNEYGVSVGNNYNVYDTSEADNLALESLELQEKADIEPDSFGTAQLRGAIGAEQKKLGYTKVIGQSLEDIETTLEAPPYIKFSILTMMGIAGGAAMYYALRGVWA